MIQVTTEPIGIVIERASLNSAHIQCAVMDLSESRHLAFRAHDVLVLDANILSEPNNSILTSFTEQGVDLFICKNLTSNVYIFDDLAIISPGKAHSEHHSILPLAVISDDQSFLQQAKSVFLEVLKCSEKYSHKQNTNDHVHADSEAERKPIESAQLIQELQSTIEKKAISVKPFRPYTTHTYWLVSTYYPDSDDTDNNEQMNHQTALTNDESSIEIESDLEAHITLESNYHNIREKLTVGDYLIIINRAAYTTREVLFVAKPVQITKVNKSESEFIVGYKEDPNEYDNALAWEDFLAITEAIGMRQVSAYSVRAISTKHIGPLLRMWDEYQSKAVNRAACIDIARSIMVEPINVRIDFIEIAKDFVEDEEKEGNMNFEDEDFCKNAKLLIKIWLDRFANQSDTNSRKVKAAIEELMEKNLRAAYIAYFSSRVDDEEYPRKINSVYVHDGTIFKDGICLEIVDNEKQILKDFEGNYYQLSREKNSGFMALDDAETFWIKTIPEIIKKENEKKVN